MVHTEPALKIKKISSVPALKFSMFTVAVASRLFSSWSRRCNSPDTRNEYRGITWVFRFFFRNTLHDPLHLEEAERRYPILESAQDHWGVIALTTCDEMVLSDSELEIYGSGLISPTVAPFIGNTLKIKRKWWRSNGARGWALLTLNGKPILLETPSIDIVSPEIYGSGKEIWRSD